MFVEHNMMKQYTKEKLLEFIKLNNLSLLSEEKVLETLKRETIIKVSPCKECKEEFSRDFRNLIKRDILCQKCLQKRSYSRKRMTEIEKKFIDKLEKIYRGLYIYEIGSGYKTCGTPVDIKCIRHGITYKQTPETLVNKKQHGCKSCYDYKIRVKSYLNFFFESKKIHNDTYIYSLINIPSGTYKDHHTKMPIICKIHGKFEQTPNSHTQGSGCHVCAGNQRSNTNDFIKKAREIHGDTYIYDKVEYINCSKKIILICKIHGEFEQTPNNHLNGNGCDSCARGMFIVHLEQFISKASEIHNNRYDYSKTMFERMGILCTIICKEHGEFQQTPSNHITHKQGCPTCAGNQKSNTNDFIKKARMIHGDTYIYDKVEYTNNSTDIIIKCIKHDNEFRQRPASHLKGSGCDICANENRKDKQKKTLDKFLQQANMTHNSRYIYDQVEYINAFTKIKIICTKHGSFKQTPDSHIRGCGCPFCGHNIQILSKEDLIEQSIIKYGDIFTFGEYNKNQEKMEFFCRIHNQNFRQKPYTFLRYQPMCIGCIKKNKCYSKQQMSWLRTMSIVLNITIIHAETEGGEYKIPNSNYKADGFCKEENKIFEYHGDFWHGNPKLYLDSDYNKVCKETFGELYKKTIKKEDFIKREGYSLEIIWESEWLNRLKLLSNIRNFRK
jgi:hypothetical protein